MKSRTHSVLPSLCKAAAVFVALGTVSPWLYTPAAAAPRLEIWRGQRVLLLLPVGVAPDSNIQAPLSQALPGLVRPSLIAALERTRKFSITSPYRFDPVLQRAVVEKRIPESEVKALVATPNLETARPLMDKLLFDQPAMIGDIQIVELRTAGTAKSPSLQLQVSARLYEQANGSPLKSIVVTSDPVSGGRPENQLVKAAAQVFEEVARQFVEPPQSFALPVPVAPPAPAPIKSPAPAPAPVAPPALPPAPPTVVVTPPNSLSTAPGESFLPVLPPARPPLGLAIPDPAGLR